MDNFKVLFCPFGGRKARPTLGQVHSTGGFDRSSFGSEKSQSSARPKSTCDSPSRFIHRHALDSVRLQIKVVGLLLVTLATPIYLVGCGGAASTSSKLTPPSATSIDSGTTPPATTPAPAVSITASPASITAGSSSTLTVTATNSTQVTVVGGDGSRYNLSSNGGTHSVSPATATTYTATATGDGGSASANATLTVTAPPTSGPAATPAPTVSITASPASITAGSSSTLTVTATNSAQVTVSGTDGSRYTLSSSGGTHAVSPATATTYTATATGDGGSASANAMLTVTAPIPVDPVGNVISNIQTTSGKWSSFGQVGPYYVDCSPSPCEGIAWSMKHNITLPSLSNDATRFSLGGTTPYGDVLFTAALIGYSTAEIQDVDHTLLPTLHNFTYDTDFYVTDASITQALEFDISYWLGSTAGMTFGTECNYLGDKSWDIWNNGTGHWVSTRIPCKLVNGWNHLTIQVKRQSDNSTLYQSITLNGTTYTLNKSYPGMASPHSTWWGINVNYQMDGNSKQSANVTYVDNLNFTYW